MGGVQKTSLFYFQYFEFPTVMSLEPDRATLSGKTTSSDGQSALFSIRNFLDVTAPEDLLVTVGTAATEVLDLSTSFEEETHYLFLR